MIQTAISGVPGLLVSDEELKRFGPSYTIDTVLHFKHSAGDPKELYLIMGIDAFLEIDTWYRYQDLLKQIAMIVIDRPNQNRLATRNDREEMHSFLRSKISGDYAFSRSLQCYQHPQRPPIHIFHVTCLRISATMIRKRLKAGRSIGFLVPRSVQDYIQSKGIYV